MENKRCPKDIDKKTLITNEAVKDTIPMSQEQIDELLTECSDED